MNSYEYFFTLKPSKCHDKKYIYKTYVASTIPFVVMLYL